MSVVFTPASRNIAPRPCAVWLAWPPGSVWAGSWSRTNPAVSASRHSKGWGASWAVARILARRLNLPPDGLSRAGPLPGPRHGSGWERSLWSRPRTAITAGPAWAARQFGQRAVVFMPKGSAEARAAAIRALGAYCEITDLAYDDAVRHAAAHARATGGVLVQDTAWDGYEEIPRWIMQGYTTLALEAREQMRAMGLTRPTHLLLQAGVGSFAAAVLSFFAVADAEEGGPAPLAVIMEPHSADCIFRSIRSGDGRAHAAAGEMRTIMAGLACGEPSSLAWGILREHAFAAVACPDGLAANGMRMLAAPCPAIRRWFPANPEPWAWACWIIWRARRRRPPCVRLWA